MHTYRPSGPLPVHISDKYQHIIRIRLRNAHRWAESAPSCANLRQTELAPQELSEICTETRLGPLFPCISQTVAPASESLPEICTALEPQAHFLRSSRTDGVPQPKSARDTHNGEAAATPAAASPSLASAPARTGRCPPWAQSSPVPRHHPSPRPRARAAPK